MISAVSKLIFLLLLLIHSAISEEDILGLNRDSWKPIDEHCEAFLRQFAETAANFTQCSTEYSVPPQVCLLCADAFAHLNMAYWHLKDDPYKTRSGETCSSEIFDYYELSHVTTVFEDLKTDIWDASKCDSCLAFVINPTKKHSHFVDFSDKTKQFLQVYHLFKNCTEEFSMLKSKSYSNSSVCDACWKEYTDVNAYYDKVFYHKDKDFEFCLDIESMMNDTVKWWRDERKCLIPEYPVKSKDNLAVGIMCAVNFLICIIFYGFNVTIGKRQKRTLKKYHRVGNNSTSIVINSNEQLHRPVVEHARLISREGTGPRRVVSFSVLPPSALG